MKKVLILSYYFPPGNMTASERIYSWAQHLNEHHIYPIIVTRSWEQVVKNSSDLFKSSGSKIEHKVYDNYEVYYLPYRSSLKDTALVHLFGTKWYPLYLILAFLSGIREIYSVWGSPLLPLYKFSKKILTSQKDIKLLIVSGNPFELFHFAYKLKKQFAIQWIADYRDDWTTNELHLSTNAFKKVIQKLSRKKEIKWVSTASWFFSVSSHYVKKIQNILPQVPGKVLLNGYMEENYNHNDQTKLFDDFTIVYTGSLYAHQPIEVFLEAFKKAIDNQLAIQLIFVGLKGEIAAVKKVTNICKGYERYIQFTERLPKKEAIRIQQKAHLLLSTCYADLQGIPGSKLYEYIALKKPVLVCPPDHDIIEKTLCETGQAFIAVNTEEAFQLLNKLYQDYLADGKIKLPAINENAIIKYSRKAQTRVLAETIHKLI